MPLRRKVNQGIIKHQKANSLQAHKPLKIKNYRGI
jgi:hypothetical protein